MGIGAGAISGASLAATALGGVASATGAMMSAAAQRQAANYQVAVAQRNAAASGQAANVSLAEGDAAAQQQLQAGAEREGAVKAALGASNIELNSGSALDDQKSIALTTGENVANTQYNALTQTVGYLNQGANFQTQAGLDKLTGGNAMTAGAIGAGTSLLGAASQVSSKWASWYSGGGAGSGGTGSPSTVGS